MTETAVYAAGGVVWRMVEDKLKILVIHRTAYVDVTLPKGKVDPGETLAETAAREILEETGIRVALGIPVGVSRYRMPKGREKIVHYWAAEATPDAIRQSQFVPNREIAAIEWLSPKKALKRLSYPVDVEILENFLRFVDDGVLSTFPVIVLRHGKATPRSGWTKPDASRPLTTRGVAQAHAAVGPLSAFGVQRIVTSDALRCVQTVRPLAKALRLPISRTTLISQDLWEAGRANPRLVIGKRVRARVPAVVCGHGPVLPDMLSELALATGTLHGSYLTSAAALPVAGFSVVHLSASNPGSGIVAIETHESRL
ncbi:NUDIX hydrolase [Microbacterium sp. No. 7]|uniref:NUDIX hydrolase n=1 Tax=Microbacterium sp. No. 7 TaxID=1714373 RepID=UPI0006CFBFCB|nr:NUDIX domain-containing protein [Microbacterium sp. No. 7]ALJ19623.1 DNA mismatch repair protein MutT [Microbacterium sp. No. 7]